ncbi:hypothetical protein [Streptomyces sp. NPDC048057]|uniref:hypothetical protein n=1 Tax=Streptomyces sp. NPDC048057 TaxID=3155628 RepID=UPI0033F45F29
MAKHRVWLTESVNYVIEVDAEDREEAGEVARELLNEMDVDQLASYFDDSTGFDVADVVKIRTRVPVAA